MDYAKYLDLVAVKRSEVRILKAQEALYHMITKGEVAVKRSEVRILKARCEPSAGAWSDPLQSNDPRSGY